MRFQKKLKFNQIQFDEYSPKVTKFEIWIKLRMAKKKNEVPQYTYTLQGFFGSDLTINLWNIKKLKL